MARQSGGRLAQMPDDIFDQILAVDLRGVFLCMKYEIRHMLKAGGGAIAAPRSRKRFQEWSYTFARTSRASPPGRHSSSTARKPHTEGN
jgi:NAD(P)-dependent dehydrogenase (short-subunit alcohol dehydrogenase family)